MHIVLGDNEPPYFLGNFLIQLISSMVVVTSLNIITYLIFIFIYLLRTIQSLGVILFDIFCVII